jgi:hypothetical protein
MTVKISSFKGLSFLLPRFHFGKLTSQEIRTLRKEAGCFSRYYQEKNS